MMERQEAAGIDLKHETAAHDEAKTTLEDAVERRDGVLGDIGVQEARRGEERTALVAELPTDLVELYDKLRSRGGPGAGELVGEPLRRVPAGDRPQRAARHPGRGPRRGRALRELRGDPGARRDGRRARDERPGAAAAWTGRGRGGPDADAAAAPRAVAALGGAPLLRARQPGADRGWAAPRRPPRRRRSPARVPRPPRRSSSARRWRGPADRGRRSPGRSGWRSRSTSGFIETDFGSWEGMTFREAAERDPEVHRAWLGDPSVAPPEGE